MIKSLCFLKVELYYSLVRYKDKFYKAMTNVGYNPTVKGEKLCVETNIQIFMNVSTGNM